MILRFSLYIKILLSYVCFFFATKMYSQDSIRISGQFINNTRFAKVVVQKFGVGVFDIVAVPIDKETGEFSIVTPMDVEPGIYRFRYSQTGYVDYVDIIINGNEKEIAFSLDVSLEADKRTPIFTTSKENEEWYQFKKLQYEKLNEILVKQSFLVNYPNKKDKSYISLYKEYGKSIKEYVKNHHQFIDKTPFYWAKSMAQYQNIYFPNLTEHQRIQEFNVHETFWESKPTKDVLLLNTPLYTDAILNYLKYYLNPEMEFGVEEQNSGLKKCVDTIVSLFSANDKTKEFAIKYIQMGFKEIGNETLLQYIDEKHAANSQCTTDDDELQKRLKGYQSLKIGNAAPEIVLTDHAGNTKTLNDYPQQEVVLVFWASWCPHCMEEMPKLQEWAKNHNKTLVLAISLDDDYTAFQNAIKQFPDMLHYCDLQKWEGKIVSDYYVAATPTFFKLDKDRKLAGKYSGFEKLIIDLNHHK